METNQVEGLSMTAADVRPFGQRLARLKRIAEAQINKRWERQEKGLSMNSGARMYGVIGPQCVSDFEEWGFTREAAAYITEADPATVLELIETLSSVTIERDEARAECNRLRAEAKMRSLSLLGP